MEPMVSVSSLSKFYGNKRAVNEISFNVKKGEIFGLLGPNGAGKTSTLECIEGLRSFSDGMIRVAGFDVRKNDKQIREVLGVQLQISSLPDEIRISEAIDLVCAWHRVPTNQDLLKRFGLEKEPNREYGKMSTGQKRRLHLALALVTNPSVVVLDEPTAGLDVEGRAQLHLIIRELQAAGVTFLLATHDMAEAEMLCDRIAIMIRGKIAAIGTPAQITAVGNRDTKITIKTAKNSLLNKAMDYSKFAGVSDESGIWLSGHISMAVGELLRKAEAADDEVIDLRVERPSLEERFLEIVELEGKK